LKKIGVPDEDELESFLFTIYEKCRKEIVRKEQVAVKSGNDTNNKLEAAIRPETVAACVRELIDFSDQKNVLLSGIPNYIKQQRVQMEAKAKEIDVIAKKTQILLREASAAQERYETALKKEQVTYEQLSNYTRMSAELKKIGFDIDQDVASFVELMDAIGNKFGFDVEQIISEFQDLNILVLKKKHLSRDVNDLGNRKEYLKQTSSTLQQLIEIHSQWLHAYRNLEAKGLGFNNLKILINAISEIARESRTTEYAATEQLFKKIEKMYGLKLTDLEDDLYSPHDAVPVYSAMSERIRLYFGPENE
jgi:hypothetical protein